MKRIYYKLLVSLSFILLVACQSSDYDLDNIVPQEYHKILSLKPSGVFMLELSEEDSEYKKELFVWKGGYQTEQPAKAALRLFTVEELAEYNAQNGTSYQLLNERNYSLSESSFELLSTDHFKKIDLVLYPNQIAADMNAADLDYILPLKLISTQDSVLATRNSIIFIIDNLK